MTDPSSYPQGIYIAYKLTPESRATVGRLMDTADVPNPCELEDLHCTLMYSATPVDSFDAAVLDDSVRTNNVVATIIGATTFESQSGKLSLVLLLECSTLTSLHNHIKAAYGLDYSHPSYNPHITVSYDCDHCEKYVETLCLSAGLQLTMDTYTVEPLDP